MPRGYKHGSMPYGSQLSAEARLAEVLGLFREVAREEYGAELDDYIGPELWASQTLDITEGSDNFLRYSGARGAALKTDDTVRQRFPSVHRVSEPITIHGKVQVGIGYEEHNDMNWLGQDLGRIPESMSMVAELPAKLKEAEEEDFLEPYNRAAVGMFSTSRQYSQNLFVDGSSGNELKMLGGEPIDGLGNEILGSPSYDTIRRIHNFGKYTLNEEGGISSMRPVMIVCSPQTAKLWRALYASPVNIYSNNPNLESPISDLQAPTILETNRMWEDKDAWVFFEGWERDMWSVDYFRGRAESGVRNSDDSSRFHVRWAEIASMYGFHAANNRRILRVVGSTSLF